MAGDPLILGLTWTTCRHTIEQIWPVAAVSLAVSLVATPICRRIAIAWNIVDRPDNFLKPHERPIPYLGGVAVFAGWIAGILVAFYCVQITQWSTLAAIAVAGLAIMLIGLFDDLLGAMRPTVKLVCNIAVAVWLICFGLGDNIVQVVAWFFVGGEGKLEPWLELMYSLPITLLIVVGACNATNLIDGLDGLCAGVLGIVSLGFFILALNMHELREISPQLGYERTILSLAMLGGAVGFLPFNRNPAKIFLGDAGSMLLGLNVAVLILLFAELHLVRWMVGSLMVFGLPLADMCLTLVRRWRNGRPLMLGDRSHFYDQLRDRGMSVRRVVAISYLLTLAFVLAGCLVIFIRTRFAVLVYAFVVMAVIAAIWKFDMVSIERDRRTGKADPSADQGKDAAHE